MQDGKIVLDVEYDKHIELKKEREDIKLLREFTHSDHKDMTIVYLNSDVSKKRRVTLHHWLNENKVYNVFLSVRDDKLVVIKKSKENTNE